MEQRKALITRRESPWSARLHAKAAAEGIALSGTFELTTRCNFNCKMCYVHDGARDTLSASEWISLAETAKNGGMVYLLLTGGEPLVRKDFPEIYSAVSEMGLMISVNTNASLVDDSILGLFEKHPPIRMNVSLYACNEASYGELCGVSAFKKVSENIKRIKNSGISVKLNSSLTPYNKDEVEGLYTFARELGVPLQATTYMFPPARRGESGAVDASRFEAEDAAKYLLKCKENYLTKEQLSALASDAATEEDVCINESEIGEGMNCRGGRSSFWVTADGRMLPCGMFGIEGFSVKEYSFDEAWRKTRALAASVRLPSECRACPLRPSCNVCAASCVTENGEFGIRPQYLCKMAGEYTRLLKEKYLIDKGYAD